MNAPAPSRLAGRRQRSKGFTLVESAVAITIFAIGAMALYGLLNSNLFALHRVEDVSRQTLVVRNAMEYLSAINPWDQPEGQVELGGIDVAWRATLVEPVRTGQTTVGAPGGFDVGLYDVAFEVRDDGRALGTWHMRAVGYKKVRGFNLDIES